MTTLPQIHRKLQARVDQDAQLDELPLDYADKQDETMIYSTHEEKVLNYGIV